MLDDRHFSAASAVQRKMYVLLTEVSELTDQLSQAVDRQDQVSVRMFLSMRQEELQRLADCQLMLRRQCEALPGTDGALLHHIQRNRALLERVRRVDQSVSRRLGGKNSFYAKDKT